MLVPAAWRRRPASAPIDPAAIPLGTLVLEAAQACNLRCTYCYAGGGAYGGAARVMPPELARRAARFLVESSGDRDRVTLVLFGGEPLLNLAALKAAVLEGEAAARACGKTFVVALTTNGTRFTPEVLDFLGAHPISVSVSIDGPPDVHDANRRYPGASGGGTYADIVAGLKRLRAHLPRPPAARVTLTPDQWGRVPEVFDHLHGLGFLEVGIAPASPVTADFLPTPEQDEALFAGFTELAQRFAGEAGQGRVLPFSNLLDLLGRLHLGQVKEAHRAAPGSATSRSTPRAVFSCATGWPAWSGSASAISMPESITPGSRRASPPRRRRGRRRATRAGRAASAPAAVTTKTTCARTISGRPPAGRATFIRRWLELGIRVYADLCRDPDNPVLAFLGRRADG